MERSVIITAAIWRVELSVVLYGAYSHPYCSYILRSVISSAVLCCVYLLILFLYCAKFISSAVIWCVFLSLLL
jgi:hypothetical protein